MPVLDITAIPSFTKPRRLHRTKILTGQRFGRLLAYSLLGMNGFHQATWLFRCDCGNFYFCAGEHVRFSNVISCGCFRNQIRGQFKTRFITHGMRRTKTYALWCHMINRTVGSSASKFPDYAGRGITVCEQLRRFIGFFAILGKCPPSKSSLDRINSNGHYSCGQCPECVERNWPLNVRWADKWEQAANKRNNHLITIGDETLHLAEWSRRTGIDRGRVLGRLRIGWTPAEALEFQPRQLASNLSKSRL